MLHSTLKKTALKKIKQIANTTLVVGLVTQYIKPKAATRIVKQAIKGLRTYYPNLQAVIINVDVGQKANTRRAIKALNSDQIPIISSRYNGILGKGAAISAILHSSLQLNPQAIVILDSTTKTITPEWIPGLITPILKHQVDLVKPRYQWPLPAGGLSDLLFYPFTRAVWGGNLRHPAAPDYALSPKLAQTILNQDVWQTEINRFGFDIWLSTFAITQAFQLVQTALGDKQPAKKQVVSLPIFKDAIGTMLRQIYIKQKAWSLVSKIKAVPTLTEFSPPFHPISIPFSDCFEYIEMLALGWMEYRPLWQRIMLPENLVSVEYLAAKPPNQFYFPPNLWAKIAYDFTVVYNKGEQDPDAVVESLYPLYLGRLASFWSEIAGLTSVGRGGTVAAQAVEFEELLPYLKYRWDNYIPWVHNG